MFTALRLTSVFPARPVDCGRKAYVLSLAAFAIAASFGAYATYSFLFVSMRRLRYPFELEWMEGGMLGHVQRLLEVKPLYPEPSPEFVPFIYGPLYSYAAALVAAIGGSSLFSLRLVSFTSTLALLVFLHRIVAFETRSRLFGLAAPCLFLATFAKSGGWFDLARVDSFALALAFAAIDVSRRARTTRHFAVSGALLACAVLAKQPSACVFPALAWWAFASGRSRALLAFAGTCAAVGCGWAVFELARSDGWFWYYTVELPLLHGTKNRDHLVGEFWRSEIFGALPIATAVALLSPTLLARLPRPGSLPFHAAIGASLVIGSYASRLHMGSYLNDLMPAHAALALLMPLGLFALGVGSEGSARLAWQATVSIAVAAQLAVLMYEVRDHLPKRGSRREGLAFVEKLRRESGDVLVVSHPQLPALAGKPWYAHQMAMVDIFEAQGDPRGVRDELRKRWRKLFEERRFSKVILDDDWYVIRPDLELFYRRVDDLPLPDGALMPVTGGLTRPKQVYVPR